MINAVLDTKRYLGHIGHDDDVMTMGDDGGDDDANDDSVPW